MCFIQVLMTPERKEAYFMSGNGVFGQSEGGAVETFFVLSGFLSGYFYDEK